MIRSIIKPRQVAALAELVKQNRNTHAIRVGKKILGQDPRNADAHYLLGLAYLGDNKPELALMELKTVNEIGQFDGYAREVPFRTKIAELYRKFNQPEEALKEYLILLKKDPANAAHYLRAGELFESRNRTDRAVTLYRKAAELDPRDAEAYQKLGTLLYRAKKPLEAKEYFDRALRLNPESYATYYYVGKIQKDNREYSAALASFERAQKDPDHKLRAILERGVTFLSMNNLQNALPELERAVNLSDNDSAPETLYARYFLGTAYEKQRRVEAAIEQWERVYARRPRFRDVAEKLSQYQDLRTDDRMKDYVTAAEDRFAEQCREITEVLGLTLRDEKAIRNGYEITAVEPQSKWRNARKLPKLIWFLRASEIIDESSVRSLHEEMKSQNINRGLIVSSSNFSRRARDFAESRPIDLYGRDKLQRLLADAEKRSA